MIKKFTVCTVPDPAQIQTAVNKMQEVLTGLETNRVPGGNTLSAEDLHAYVESLVRGQRPAFGETVAGSWSVAETDAQMPHDARVDFIFVPTYVAVATLGRYLCDYPEPASRIHGFLEAFKSGLEFCTHRNLCGAGYEADAGLLTSLKILNQGKIPELLAKHPEYCPKLKERIDTQVAALAKQAKVNLSGFDSEPWQALGTILEILIELL